MDALKWFRPATSALPSAILQDSIFSGKDVNSAHSSVPDTPPAKIRLNKFLLFFIIDPSFCLHDASKNKKCLVLHKPSESTSSP